MLRPAPRMDVAELVEVPQAALEAPAAAPPAVEIPATALAAPVPEVPVAALEAPAFDATKLSDVVPQDLSLPDLQGPDLSGIIDVASQFVRAEYLPLIAAFTVVPLGAFLIYVLLDGAAGLFRFATGAKTEYPSVSGPLAAEAEGEPSVWAEDSSFDSELSAWPVLLQLRRELEAMPAEEARRTKLEVGTNWKPRTTTAKPFADDREGFMFFQGPTPLTGNQPDLPGFFSSDNLSQAKASAASIGGTQKAVIAVAAAGTALLFLFLVLSPLPPLPDVFGGAGEVVTAAP